MENKKINVLIIATNGLGKTGVPNVIYHVVQVLSDFANIDLITFNDDAYYNQKIASYGVNIIKANIQDPKFRIFRPFYRLFKEGKDYYKFFSKLFNTKQYDVIHSFREYGSAYIFELASNHHIQKMIIHCNNEIYPPKNLINRFVFNKKMKIIRKYTSDLIGVSRECCRISYSGMPFKVIHNTFDNDIYNNGVRSLLDKSDFVLTQVATFSNRKNQLFTVELFYEILKLFPQVKLYLVGVEAEQGYLNIVKERVESLGISNHVSFIDGSKDIRDVFRHTTFLLLPSFSEGAPLAPIEAQACGITCFVSDYVTREINCGGVVYLPLDKKVWSEEISRTYKEIRNDRKTFDIKEFEPTTFSKKILELYDLI